MEDSYACLRRSLSQPSSDEKKGNPLQRALTTSVSFGRFMSESLDWEKWSAFTHNRYLEEVEKYSKPGSVAEKKAYFEAHYKRRRAAALLEQQNKVEDNGQRDSCVLIDTIKEEDALNSDAVCSVGQTGGCEIEREIERVTELPVLMENDGELTSHLENDGEIGDNISKKEHNVCKKDDSTMRNSVSPIEKKPEVSSSMLLTNGGAPKHAPSIKLTTPIRLKNNDKIPNNKKDTRDMSNKRRSRATSLHMSINFASCSGETQKPTSPNMPKITNSRLVRTPIRKSGNNALSQTSTKTSTSGIFKHHSTLPLEHKRTTTRHLDSISESKTDGKLQTPSTNESKSSSTFGSKARSLPVSSFTFKSEERAAKRKEFFEKLEQKCRSKETEKQQLNAKSQVKARSDFKDLRDSISVKATKTTEIPQTIESSNSFMKKIPSTRPFSPKIQDRTVFKVKDNDSRPPWRFSGKTDNRPPICSAKAFLKKTTCENASPNIQL